MRNIVVHELVSGSGDIFAEVILSIVQNTGTFGRQHCSSPSIGFEILVDGNSHEAKSLFHKQWQHNAVILPIFGVMHKYFRMHEKYVNPHSRVPTRLLNWQNLAKS